MVDDHTEPNRKSIDFLQMIDSLCQTAKKGLAYCYAEPLKLPYTVRGWAGSPVKREGASIRYAAISQIGIAKWLRCHPEDQDKLPDLWPAITDRLSEIDHIGDMALSLWAGIETGADNCLPFAKALAKFWDRQEKVCNSVELGWVLMAVSLAIQSRNELEPIVRPLLEKAHANLLSLFNPQSNLFQRHNRKAFGEILHRQVACFADQVYPILAMATYGMIFEDAESIDLAARVVDSICHYQGPLGQWQWHYDVCGNKVCEEYPVFSVHQDAMAPMAILASDKASNHDHTSEIELGMRWLFGENELEENMVLEQEGIVWRDIERKEPGKFSRTVRSLCCLLSADRVHESLGKCFRHFRVNRECRPYHLGWILYAWAGHAAETSGGEE